MLEVTVRVAVPNGLVLAGLIVAVKPLEVETARNTTLLNPFNPFRLIVDVPELPAATLRLVGLALMVKSGWFEKTVTGIVSE